MNAAEKKLLLAAAELSLVAYAQTEGLTNSVNALRKTSASYLQGFEKVHRTQMVKSAEKALESNGKHLHKLARQVRLLVTEVTAERNK